MASNAFDMIVDAKNDLDLNRMSKDDFVNAVDRILRYEEYPNARSTRENELEKENSDLESENETLKDALSEIRDLADEHI
jgi:hypothetical protein